MKYLVSAEEMKRYDRDTIEKIGIPAMVLMERAALAVVEEICSICETFAAPYRQQRVFVLAGMGNNGGDGLAIARLLSEEGFRVEVKCVGNPRKASGQWQEQYAILQHYGVTFVETPGQEAYDCLVDALFGVGLSREITGEYQEAIAEFNGLQGYKIAVDLPSGIHTDSGAILGNVIKADITVTFGFCKRGLVYYPGCEYAGKVKVADIGITKRSFFGVEPGMFTYDESVEVLCPKRNPAGNKGTFGKILLVAGSNNMAGAAILAGKAAYRAGAGMVKVITPEQNRVIMQEVLPEALLGTEDDLSDSLKWADVLVVGPGLGKSDGALKCLRAVIAQSRKPLVIDADGLNLLSEHMDLQEQLALHGRDGRDILLTPHMGELARLAGKTIADCKEHPVDVAMALAEKWNAVVVAKDARTHVCAPGRAVYLNSSGNSGLATAGSGDVLAGVCGALLGQGMDGFEAASLSVYLHGKAGEAVSLRLGESGCMAGDLVEEIGKAWKL